MGVLRSIYEPRGVTVPPPVEVVCTRWGTDPFCYGAYSSMAVGTVGGEDYNILGESLGGRVRRAGAGATAALTSALVRFVGMVQPGAQPGALECVLIGLLGAG